VSDNELRFVTDQLVPVAVAYCTDHPARLFATSPALKISMKSFLNGAPELPPPPYTWLITIRAPVAGDGDGEGEGNGVGVGEAEGCGVGDGNGVGLGPGDGDGLGLGVGLPLKVISTGLLERLSPVIVSLRVPAPPSSNGTRT